MALANRLAIIVGGLGGLGTIAGQRLRAKGARLALLHAPFESSKVESTLKESYNEDASSLDIRAYECDIVSPDSVTAAFSNILSDNAGFPSILINSAGIVNLQPLEDFKVSDIKAHYDINLLGPTLTCQAFARLYFARAKAAAERAPGGRIVNLASQAAHVALHHHGPYCASKAGLIGLTKCMASEWGPRGITANTISPGPVMTELGKQAWADDRLRAEYLAAVPTGNFAEPSEVGNMIEFLCRDESLSINGVDIRLDGGFTIR